MKILFLSMSGLTYDATTPEHAPLGGTESSFCYLARELAAQGYDVTLCARNMPKETLLGVKHDNECNAGDYDMVISNGPIQFTGDRKPYYVFWNHLAHFDNSIKSLIYPEVMGGIDCVVYVSEWQKNECEKQFGKAKKTVVIGNGFAPIFENMFACVDELVAAKQKELAIYTSTPYRGLRMLPEIMDNHPEVYLKVYSGLKVYQSDDRGYQSIYEKCRNHSDIGMIGNVSQKDLMQAAKEAKYMFYPCIFPETYCIAALEGMAAGLQIVTSNLGALPDTLHGFGVMAREENSTLDELLERFNAAIDYAQKNYDAENMFKQLQYVNNFCTWRERAKQWVNEVL